MYKIIYTKREKQKSLIKEKYIQKKKDRYKNI